jgi:hypothetical protein
MINSSTPTLISNPLTSMTIFEKLSIANHALWKMQILAVIRGVDPEGYLTRESPTPTSTIKSTYFDGKDKDVLNPAFQAWSIIDQHVLGFLLSFMTKESLSQVYACHTVSETWTVTEGNIMSATRAHIVNSRIALATTKKGELSIVNYITNMCTLGDELAIAGKPLNDNDLISYILVGLDFDYNSVVTMRVAKENLTICEVYSQLLSFEQPLELQGSTEHYPNVATSGRGSTRGRSAPQGGSRSKRPRRMN